MSEAGSQLILIKTLFFSIFPGCLAFHVMVPSSAEVLWSSLLVPSPDFVANNYATAGTGAVTDEENHQK